MCPCGSQSMVMNDLLLTLHQDEDHNSDLQSVLVLFLIAAVSGTWKVAASRQSTERSGSQYRGQSWMFLAFDLPNTYFWLPLLNGYILKYFLLFYNLWLIVSLNLGSFL